MFFVAAKLFWLVAAPLNLAVLLGLGAVAGILCRCPRLARRLAAAALAVLLLAAATPLGPYAAAVLERRFVPAPALPAAIAGILVLGGGIDTERSLGWGRPILGAEAERLTALIDLGRRYPEAPVIYAGGFGGLGTVARTEAAFARDFLLAAGFDLTRVAFDGRSRNTRENAVEARMLAGDSAGRPWVLVTGALHMPRAVAVFRHEGWQVIPWPVAPVTPGPDAMPWTPLDTAATLGQSTRALREWIGLAAYRAAGYTATLLPK
ncbi:YdcF family protein [Zavarzinia compransoris]|uniref:YdcF family protein n=1 Tax=Zavarzinia compransoris TaxID=1264899 RepID=A0A317DWB4_9PROT|nr:YdcF family protein [Zavarzinia compransoris]PWR18979.1 YdcF family protein [Zavarzinia compransoris]TDP48980.1 uncharacterized SAM-binding protein YcdF (DUF218 family) [Zavarzinia compransoris]